jgi:hypothetical protein
MPPSDIHQRYANLRHYRVGLRRETERLRGLLRLCSGDEFDVRQALAVREAQLVASEKEWRELSTMLGKAPPRPPIRLDAR